MKRMLAVLLSVLLLMTCIPLGAVSVVAATTGQYNYLFYKTVNGKVTITECDPSASGSINIPDEIGGCPVTAIANLAFRDCVNIESVWLSKNIVSIGAYAFSGCTSLTFVCGDIYGSIGDGAFDGCSALVSIDLEEVDSIGEFAFADCSALTAVTFRNITTLPYGAFFHCTSLAVANIRGEITTIEDSAFSGCVNLTYISIPDSVTTINYAAFSGCDSLTDVYYGGSEADKANITIDWNTSLLNATWHYHSTPPATGLTYKIYGGEVTITGYTTYLPAVLAIPNTIEGYPVTTIGSWAFDNCYVLNSVTIPDSVTSIGYAAFENCKPLTSVTIGNSVTSIEGEAFYDCDSLTSVTIPDSVTVIGREAFYNCDSLTSVTIGNGVTAIGTDAFYNCRSLNSVYISDIAAWCAINFSLSANPLNYATNLYLNGELVTDLVIPDSVTTIGRYAFYDCDALTSVTIGDSVTVIGSDAFSSCSSLTSVTMGDRVTTIEFFAFGYCDALTSVTIPHSITTIGDYAFFDCDALTDVYYSGSKADRANITIDSYNTALLYATWHYNYTPPCDHVYEDEYDATCNACGEVREVPERPGDANGDGAVNARDAALLQQYVAGWDVSLTEASADANGDGSVNARDVALLQQYLAGWDVTLG